jgi:TPR repeat protein
LTRRLSSAAAPAARLWTAVKKPLALLTAAAWLMVSAAPSYADFADGLAAFDAGDFETAFGEWRALADAGDIEAQVALAGLYLTGSGTRADAAQAFAWYRRAAEAGDPVAQLNLGDFYSRGVGTARDPVAAYVWLSLSAAQGRRWPEQRRREIAKDLSPAQLAEAEARLKAFLCAD